MPARRADLTDRAAPLKNYGRTRSRAPLTAFHHVSSKVVREGTYVPIAALISILTSRQTYSKSAVLYRRPVPHVPRLPFAAEERLSKY